MPLGQRVVKAAVTCSTAPILRWDMSQGCPFNLEAPCKASLMLASIEQVHLLLQIWPFEVVTQKLRFEAARNGHFEVLHWLTQPNLGCLSHIVPVAARNGHLQVLQRLLIC